MASSVVDEIKHDQLVVAIARALTLANEVATAQGMNLTEMQVAITEESCDAVPCWKIYYSLRDYVNTRGGDLFVFVDRDGNAVQRVLYGQ